ncbi:MAG: hypothetical protein V1838_01055 [Patescibacteria group bacterium]
MDDTNNQEGNNNPQPPQAESPEGTATPQSNVLVEVMHGVILATVLITASYMIGITYWAISYGAFA